MAIDARWLQTPLHGLARYCLNLIAALPVEPQQSLVVIYNRANFDPGSQPDLRRPGLIWLDCRVPLFCPTESLAMTRLLAWLRPSLLHLSAYWKPYASPCPWLMTVHDLIHVEEADLKYRFYYAWLRRHLRHAAGLITVSHAAADAIRAWSGLEAEVTYPGVEARYRPGQPGPLDAEALAALGIRSPYFLYIGNPKPHKRPELALAASARLERPHQLVSLGIPASGQPGHLALQGLPEALMPALYQGATGLLMPSRQEGFGLPAAEATASACPVLAADIPVLREVLPAARHLPDEAQSWAEAMADLMVQRPAGLTEAAQQASSRFALEELGQRTLALYTRCLAGAA